MKDLQRIVKRIQEGRLKELVSEWQWMLLYVRHYWLLILAYTGLGAFGSLMGLGISIVSKDLVDVVTGQSAGNLARTALFYVGIGVAQLFINLRKTRLSLKIRLKINNEIREDIYTQILHTDWEALSGYRTGDFLYRVNGDAGMVSDSILSFIPNMVSAFISFGGAFLVMVKNDPWMAVIALIGAPVTFYSSRRMARKMREYQSRNQNVSTNKMSFDQETFQNLQSIKAFGMVDRFTEKLHEIQQESMALTLEQNKFQGGMMIMNSLVGQVIGYLCYGFAVYRLWQGDITYGTMTMFVTMATSLRSSFNGILNLLPTAVRAATSAGRIMEMVNLPRENLEYEEEAKAMRVSGAEDGIRVTMENVSFQYEEKTPVFENADFCAAPGEIVALAGPSGQGKTTMLRLFLGLFHPYEGRITVRNTEENHLDVSASTRCLFSYVPQGNTLFTGTIAENMRLVKPDATEEEIQSALEAACAWKFVSRLPDGMHTQVQERGKRFSEGQRQRLSIARAILTDAPVILLDEATSALDAATERKLLARILKKDPHRTVIIAAHRPSVFAVCSKVYMVSEGCVNEISKEELERFLSSDEK